MLSAARLLVVSLSLCFVGACTESPAVGLPDPMLAAKASAVGIAEMFLPATVVAGHESELLRLVIGVVCVSAIIFFSALVPCILATRIPIKLWQLFAIWAQRVALSLLIATPIAYLMVGR